MEAGPQVPIIGYAKPSTPSAEQVARQMRHRDRKPMSPELMAALGVVGSALLGLIGLLLRADNGSVGSVMIFPAVGFTLWFVVARLGRRRRTPAGWRVVMFGAAVSAIAYTWATVMECDGYLLMGLQSSWATQDRAWGVATSVAVFAAAEVGALVHLRIADRRETAGGTTSERTAGP